MSTRARILKRCRLVGLDEMKALRIRERVDGWESSGRQSLRCDTRDSSSTTCSTCSALWGENAWGIVGRKIEG